MHLQASHNADARQNPLSVLLGESCCNHHMTLNVQQPSHDFGCPTTKEIMIVRIVMFPAFVVILLHVLAQGFHVMSYAV